MSIHFVGDFLGAEERTQDYWGPSQLLDTRSQWPILFAFQPSSFDPGTCSLHHQAFLTGFFPFAAHFLALQMQFQFLTYLLLTLLSAFCHTIKFKSPSKSPGPLSWAPFLLHTSFLPSQDDSLPSPLPNHWHLSPGFCLHFLAVLYPLPKHMQPQNLGAMIRGLRACSLGAGVCLVQTETSLPNSWECLLHLSKGSAFSQSRSVSTFLTPDRSSSMPNIMSMLQGMGILELINWMVVSIFKFFFNVGKIM